MGMGYTRSEIEDSLTQAKYDDVFATYLLLGRKSTDVSLPCPMCYLNNSMSMGCFPNDDDQTAWS